MRNRKIAKPVSGFQISPKPGSAQYLLPYCTVQGCHFVSRVGESLVHSTQFCETFFPCDGAFLMEWQRFLF